MPTHGRYLWYHTQEMSPPSMTYGLKLAWPEGTNHAWATPQPRGPTWHGSQNSLGLVLARQIDIPAHIWSGSSPDFMFCLVGENFWFWLL